MKSINCQPLPPTITMQEAYTYRITSYSRKYFVYTDEILLGILQKKMRPRQSVLIEIMDHQYRLETSGFINPVITVTNITTKKLTGKIKIFNFARLLPKVIFEYNNIQLRWVNKSIFSLHWQWKKEDATIIEAIEKFEVGEQKGVIILSDYFRDADLLIMVGVYLQNNIKLFSLNRFAPGKAEKASIINS